jgi:transcriptional regulator with XRE-family HTH domain
MPNEGSTGVEDIVRRNIAALRAKAGLTQQGLADEMFVRGIGWTRETVAQVETTNRRIGLTEAIAVAACLDVPLARLTSTGADSVAVGDSRWTTPYLAAAIAGTAGDIFPLESYAAPVHAPVDDRGTAWDDAPTRTTAPGDSPLELERRRRPRDRRLVDPVEAGRAPDVHAPAEASDAPHRAAERIERRLRLRVTASDVDSTAQHLYSRSLEAERERRVTDRHTLTGGSLPTIRGHVSRDLDREIAHEMEKRAERFEEPERDERVAEPERVEWFEEPEQLEGPERVGRVAPGPGGVGPLTADEAAWEATRLNIILANKGYSDSDVTRWWNFTRHRELGDQTIAEAWRDGRYTAVSRLIQSLPDKNDLDRGQPGA